MPKQSAASIWRTEAKRYRECFNNAMECHEELLGQIKSLLEDKETLEALRLVKDELNNMEGWDK